MGVPLDILFALLQKPITKFYLLAYQRRGFFLPVFFLIIIDDFDAFYLSKWTEKVFKFRFREFV